jgi:hypothetical protein
MKFIYGVIIEKRYYGWHKGDLYALPFDNKNRYFTLRKLKWILIGNNVGYCLQGKKFTIDQLKEITVQIDKNISIIKHSDIPF